MSSPDDGVSGGDAASAAAVPASAVGPAHLPAPRSHSAAGAAEEVAGSIGPRVKAFLPTATLKLSWEAVQHMFETRIITSTLPLPPAIERALVTDALLGETDNTDYRIERRELAVTKAAGGVFTIAQTVQVDTRVQLTAERRAQLAAVPGIASHETSISDGSRTWMFEGAGRDDRECTTVLLHLAPSQTTSETRVRTLLAAATGALYSHDHPNLTVTTEDATVQVYDVAFPVGKIEVKTESGAFDDEQPFSLDDKFGTEQNLLWLSDGEVCQKLSLLLPAAERQRAAARVRIAEAVAFFFAAET
jgi:hypothetical protein